MLDHQCVNLLHQHVNLTVPMPVHVAQHIKEFDSWSVLSPQG